MLFAFPEPADGLDETAGAAGKDGGGVAGVESSQPAGQLQQHELHTAQPQQQQPQEQGVSYKQLQAVGQSPTTAGCCWRTELLQQRLTGLQQGLQVSGMRGALLHCPGNTWCHKQQSFGLPG